MQSSQQLKKQKSSRWLTPFFSRALPHQRIIAAVVFLGITGVFGIAWLAAAGKLDLSFWLGTCGLKQRYGIPCPTCGMTTSVLAFSKGKIIDSFYIQPAAGLLCCVLVIVAFLSFLVAVFGVYFEFIKRFFAEIKIKYIILALIIITAAGWAVTLARALSV